MFDKEKIRIRLKINYLLSSVGPNVNVVRPRRSALAMKVKPVPSEQLAVILICFASIVFSS
jgi:hypothetical protein